MAYGCESTVGVVLSKQDSVLCAAGEHSVWFVGAFGDEVVYEYTDIGLVASKDEWFLFVVFEVAVDSGHESLTGCLLIASGPVDLSCEIEVRQPFCFEGVVELGGWEVVVFNGISRAEHSDVFHAWDEAHSIELHFFGE